MKKKRVLILFEYGFAPGLHQYGSAQRSEHLLKALQSEALCDVVVLHEESGEEPPAVDLSPLALLLRPEEKLHYFYRPLRPVSRLKKLFRKRYGLLGIGPARAILRDGKTACFTEVHELLARQQYDAVVVRYILTGMRADIFGKTSVPILLDVDDSPLEFVDNKAPQWIKHTPLFGLGRRIAIRWMRSVLRSCMHAWWVKQSDLQPFENACRNSLLANIPVFPEQALSYPQKECGFKVLFVGLVSYGPNRSGLLHFLERVWPLVIQQAPDAEFCVIGKGADDELLSVMERIGRVTYHGFQQDVMPFYAECSLSVCPIYQGGGSKIKVLESLAYGRPAVVTNHAFEGADGLLDDEHGVLLAESDQEFAKKIVQVKEQAEWAEEISKRGAEAVRSTFSNEVFLKQVLAGLEE